MRSVCFPTSCILRDGCGETLENVSNERRVGIDQEKESDANAHLCAGVRVTRGCSNGEGGFALHDGVGRLQRAEQGVHDVMALGAQAEGLLHGHVRQHRGCVGDGSVSFAGQGVD